MKRFASILLLGTFCALVYAQNYQTVSLPSSVYACGKIECIYDSLFVGTSDGIYAASMNNANIDLKPYAFKGKAVKDFVKNKTYILAICNKTEQDNTDKVILSPDNGNSNEDITLDVVSQMSNVVNEGVNIVDVVCSPHDKNTIALLNDNGCIVETKDFGKSWKQLALLDMSSICFNYSASNSNQMYCGGTSYVDEGVVYSSSNAGITWKKIYVSEKHSNAVRSIAIMPKYPETVFFADANIINTFDGTSAEKQLEETPDFIYSNVLFEKYNSNVVYSIGFDIAKQTLLIKEKLWYQSEWDDVTSCQIDIADNLFSTILDVCQYKNKLMVYTTCNGIIIVDGMDIDITEPFYEAFADGQGLFEANDVQKDEGLDYVWKHDAKYGYMKASAYNGANNAAESWLLSPWISFSDAEVVRFLNFDHCINKYFGNVEDEATVWIRKQGGEWKQLPIAYPQIEEGKAWSSFKPVCVDLAGYEGHTLQVGFRYTSTAQAAGAWEIRNFGIDTNSANGIETVNGERQVQRQGIYNLAGQRLKEPAQGINIIDGRKVVKR